MGDYAKAIAVLQRAITLFPTPEAYSNLGIAYFDLRRFDDSVAALQHACTPTTKDDVYFLRKSGPFLLLERNVAKPGSPRCTSGRFDGGEGPKSQS